MALSSPKKQEEDASVSLDAAAGSPQESVDDTDPVYAAEVEKQTAELNEFQRKEEALEAELNQQDSVPIATIPLPQPVVPPFTSTDQRRQQGIISEVAATKIEDSIFKRMRASMFKTGKDGMFMLGTPSAQVLQLLIRMYNENVIRIAMNVPSPEKLKNFKAMLGVLHINDELYVTISEDPREDEQYYNKIKLIFTLLKNTNCEVIYDEQALFEEGPSKDQTVIDIFGPTQSRLFPTIPFVYRNPNNQTAVLTKMAHDNVNGALLLDTWSHKGGKEYDYSRDLNKPLLQVHFVHSLKYLAKRRPEDPAIANLMFPPIKKVADSTRPGFHECANGSTCSEAKLFSYMHEKYDQPGERSSKATFDSIQGYAAYWIPMANPPGPGNILENYNYKDKAGDEYQTKFEEILSVIKRNVPDIIKPEIETSRFRSFSQLFALPCPGCFLNYNNYVDNKMEPYDLSTCVKSRTSRLYTSGGGSRRRRNKINKAKRRTVRGVALKRNNHTNRKHTRKCRCRTCRGGTKRTRK
jgi:hypothetical protein